MVKGEKVGEGVKLRFVCRECGRPFERYRSQVRPKTGGQYCSRPCAAKGTAEQRKRFGAASGMWKGGGASYRQRAFRAFGERCQRCDYDRYPELLWVHHKDLKSRRDPDCDNSLANLEVLCVRCHLEVHLAVRESSPKSLDVPKSSPNGEALGGCDAEIPDAAEPYEP